MGILHSPLRSSYLKVDAFQLICAVEYRWQDIPVCCMLFLHYVPDVEGKISIG